MKTKVVKCVHWMIKFVEDKILRKLRVWQNHLDRAIKNEELSKYLDEHKTELAEPIEFLVGQSPVKKDNNLKEKYFGESFQAWWRDGTIPGLYESKKPLSEHRLARYTEDYKALQAQEEVKAKGHV